MPNDCENCKANPVDILRNLKGADLSDKAKLVAILEAFGVTDREQVESILEAKSSTIRDARRALKIQRQKSVSDGNPAPEIRRCDENPSKTTEIQRQKSSDPSRACATKESPTEISSSTSQLASARESEDIAEAMITDIIGWMHGGDRKSAENWLASTSRTFGNNETREAYHKLKTDLLTGTVVSRKLQAWSEIARRFKANPPAKKPPAGAEVVPFKVTVAMHPNARPRDEVMGAVNA